MSGLPTREYVHPITVEFEDVDAFRIVHHAKFVLFLERARLHLFADRGVDLEPGPVHPVLYRLEVEYKKPARLLDRLAVSVGIDSVDEYRLVLGYRVRKGAELIAKARTTLAFIDAATQDLVPVPPEFVERLRGRRLRKRR